MSPLRWTSKSTRRLSEELGEQGFQVSPVLVSKLLRSMGYSLQGNSKTREGKEHPDRDAQFQYIASKVDPIVKTVKLSFLVSSSGRIRLSPKI